MKNFVCTIRTCESKATSANDHGISYSRIVACNIQVENFLKNSLLRFNYFKFAVNVMGI